MSTIAIRPMGTTEINRLGEIDRSEHVTEAYVCENGVLTLGPANWYVGPWSPDGEGGHSVKGRIIAWRKFLEDGGTMWGAFHGDRWVGIAIYWPNLSHDMAQLAVLHVSNGCRRQGIGQRLAAEALAAARADGKKRLYVSAAQSKPAVDFYMKLGFRPAREVNKELYELEPDGIHMVLDL